MRITNLKKWLCDKSMQKPDSVILYASQIAACIGYNRHKKPWEAMESMWERVSPETYRDALRRTGSTTEAEMIEAMIQENTIVAEIIQASEAESRDSEDVATKYDAACTMIKHLNLSDDDQMIVDATVKRNLYTNYGTSSEHKALTKIQEHLGIEANPDDMFYKMQVGTVDGVGVYVGGKIDAITADRKLVVEIKNRIRRLFHKVPFYEVIQLQTYLHLLQVERGMIVECLNATQEDVSMNIVPVSRDSHMWNHVLVPKMREYARVFIELLTSTEFQDQFLSSTPQRRNSLVVSKMAKRT